jgi:hypothetical protein
VKRAQIADAASFIFFKKILEEGFERAMVGIWPGGEAN